MSLAPPSSQPATKVRHTVVAVTALMAVLLYLDRFCISIAETYIGEDLGLSARQIGWMLSAFFWTYALMQVPSGWATDRFGARKMLTLYILAWSVLTGFTGLAFGFVSVMIVRFAFGIAQAGAYPSGAAVIGKWVPFRGRGTASSIVAVGGRVGGFLAFSITGPILVLLVPMTQSSRIGPEDLLDVPRLSARLLEMSQPPSSASKQGDEEVKLSPELADKLLAGFGAELRPTIDRVAEEYEQRQKKVEALKKENNGEAEPPPIQVTLNAKTQFANALNAMIAQRNLFPSDEIPEGSPLRLAMESEGKRMLARLRSELNQSEVERLNRLVLEAAFPEAIRKVYGRGWRSVMWIFGGVGLLVAGLYWFSTRDEPEMHPRVNQQEIAVIHSGRPPGATKTSGKARGVPIIGLVTSPSIWLVSLSQWFTNIGWVFIVTWAPRYFQTVHHVPIELRSWMTAIPPLVGWFGMVAGGWLTDSMTRRIGLRWGRALPLGLSRFVAAAAYGFCLLNPSPWAAVAALAVVAFGTDLGTAATWAFNQDVGGRNVASVLGFGNMCGNLGAAVTPLLLPYVIDMNSPNWNAAFLICGGAFILSGICGLGVNASRPIVKEEDDDEPRSKGPFDEKPFGADLVDDDE